MILPLYLSGYIFFYLSYNSWEMLAFNIFLESVHLNFFFFLWEWLTNWCWVLYFSYIFLDCCAMFSFSSFIFWRKKCWFPPKCYPFMIWESTQLIHVKWRWCPCFLNVKLKFKEQVVNIRDREKTENPSQ